MKRMLEACVSSTIRVALGKHLLNKKKMENTLFTHIEKYTKLRV